MRTEFLVAFGLLSAGLVFAPVASADSASPGGCGLTEGCLPNLRCVDGVDAAVTCVSRDLWPPCTDPAGCNKHNCPAGHDQGNDCHHRNDP